MLDAVRSEPIHEERQHVAAWVHVVVIAALGGAVFTVAVSPPEVSVWWSAVPLLVGVAVYVLFTPMTLTVDSDVMRVRFGRVGWPQWVFPVEQIKDPHVVGFRPLRDYGGWGIRRGQSGTCLNQRGNRGVRFQYAGGTYTVGSDDPERLLMALNAAKPDTP